MSQREVVIKGGPNKTAAFVTGQEELLVRLGSEAVGLATESTLQAVLTTLQAFTEYEAKFVLDAANEIFLEVRVWNEDSGTWAGTPTYYRPGQVTPASPAPVAPIVYADNAPILVNILTEIQSITYAEDTPHVSGGNGVFVLGVRNDTDTAMTSDNGDYSPIAVTNTGALKVSSGPGLVKIPGALRPNNTSGDLNTVADTLFSVSVANVGLADGTILSPSVTIKPGEVLNFSADALNNYFTSFPYDATGTEFIIIYVTD